jgi:hypothetical protein
MPGMRAGVITCRPTIDPARAVGGLACTAMKVHSYVLGAVLGASLLAACGDNHEAAPDAPAVVAPSFGPSAAFPLLSGDGEFYTANVTIGGQTFALDLDTGSTTTGVAQTSCTDCAGLSPMYSPSATATDTHGSASTQYGDGSTWAGEIFTDSVGLGNDTPNVNLSFVAINTEDGFFDDNGNLYQGILGLGPDDLLERGTNSFVDKVVAAGAQDKLSFELCDESGTMWVGDPDPSTEAAAPQLAKMQPINRVGFYAISLDDIQIGGQSIGVDNTTFDSPIVDTGTSLWYLPQAAITALETQVNASPAFQQMFPGTTLGGSNSHHGCITAGSGVTADMIDAALPPLTLFMADTVGGDIQLSLKPSQSYLAELGNGRFCMGIQAGDADLGSILGDEFLTNFVTTIDIKNGVIAFAPDAGCAAANGTTTARKHSQTEHGHPKPRYAPGLLHP